LGENSDGFRDRFHAPRPCCWLPVGQSHRHAGMILQLTQPRHTAPRYRYGVSGGTSELAVHDVQPDVAVDRVAETLGHRSEHIEAN
jgi:hypothetical protein